MPSTDQNKSSQNKTIQNKKRLGRGLGSLLTTHPNEFAQDTKIVPKAENSEVQVASSKKETEKRTPETQKAESQPKQSLKKEAEVNKNKNDPNNLSDINRVWSMAIEKVFPNKSQPRKDFNKEPLEELAQSIRSQGVLQPITVRKKDEGYEIIAGERRWRASQMAGLKEVPIIIRNVDDQKVMELALIENLQREDLNPLEEAMGFQQLIEEYDLTQADLAQKVGKSRSSITNALRILSLPNDVRQLLREGSLSVGHAKVLMSIQDPRLQKELANKSVTRQWSVRALELQLRTGAGSTDDNLAKADVREKIAKQLVEQVQKAIGTKVGLRYKNGKGRIEIHFYSDEELSNYCENLKESASSL